VPNPQRGEVQAKLGGQAYTLRLTLGALAELEAALEDEDIISFTERLSQGQMRASDLIHLIGAALRGAGHKVSDEQVATMMPEGGFAEAMQIAAELIALAFGGKDQAQDKKKVISLGSSL